jgi:hypothetical protein
MLLIVGDKDMTVPYYQRLQMPALNWKPVAEGRLSLRSTDSTS